MALVAVCEDDARVRVSVRRVLEHEGHDVFAAATAAELLAGMDTRRPDVVVLDVRLPDADGRDLCSALASRGVNAPVLMLTGLDGVHNKVAGFHAGADDYLTKPFDVPELLARIGALLRRAPTTPAPGEELVLDPAGHCIVHQDRRVLLSPTEFRLLARLVRAPGEVIRRNQLIAAAWPHEAMVSENSLDSYIRRLRGKLDALAAGDRIGTVRGVGYRWR